MQDNPAFHRNYYTQPGTPVEWTPFSDIRRGHSKWENRIFRAIKVSLTAEDWMERRNALLLLSQCYETFPVVEKYARAILQSVEYMRDQEEFSDVKTLANSLAVKLRSQRDRWLDKAPPSNPDGRRDKKPTASASAAAPVDGKRPVEQAPSDRRSRRDSGEESKLVDTAVGSGERPVKELKEHKEAKDGKDGKEPKEGKTRDRAESKTPKEAREPKEARTNEKESKRAAGERKDRERDKLQERSTKGVVEKDAQVGDRKRSSSNAVGSSASANAPPATHADDRPDKRRRVERDGDGGGGHSTATAPSGSSRAGGGGAGGASDRGASDRHSGYGHQPRNALTSAPEAGTSSSAYYRSSQPTHSSHDYRRGSGYSSHTGHSGHSGSRYDSHRTTRR